MPEAVSSKAFQAAFDGLPTEQKQFEVTWAIDEIEQDPSWGASPMRFVAPADSTFSGFIVDFSVEGYGIVYKTVDHGAAVELWYLFEIPTPPKRARARRPSPAPMM